MNATIDREGNRHTQKGTPGAGQFAAKHGSAPTTPLTDSTRPAESAPSETARVYRIPADKFAAFLARIDEANRRLEKNGVQERFTYVKTSRTITDKHTGFMHQVHDVTLNTPSISCGDWKFTGAHTRAANGAILHHYATGNTTPVDTMMCEHCGHNRARQRVFTVTNPETGETKQVGSNCLELFLGVHPKGLWALEDGVDLTDLDTDDDEVGAFGFTENSIVTADQIFTATFRQVLADGRFIPRTNCAPYEVPTANSVIDRIKDGTVGDATAEETTRLGALLKWVDSVDATDNDYLTNLQTVLAPDEDGHRVVTAKHIPLAASAVTAYERHLDQIKRRKAAKELDARKVKAFLAEPETSLKGKNVTAEILRVALGHDYGYGAPLHVSMIDDDGHILYWKCTGQLGLDIDEGSRVRIVSGRVKDNRVSDYNGDWETIIARARLEIETAV